MFCVAAKNVRVQRVKVIWVQILWRQVAATNGWDMQQLHERDEIGVGGQETNTREVNVVAPTISTIRGQQERVMDAMTTPKRHAVVVVLKDAGKA